MFSLRFILRVLRGESFFFAFAFAFPSNAINLFESNFECGQTYTASALKPGAKRIELLPCEDLSQWPTDGGQGVVEHNFPEATDVFEYASREDRILKGVTGLKNHHPKWVDVRTGNFLEWSVGKSRDAREDTSSISITSALALAGAHSVVFEGRSQALARLHHTFATNGQKTVYCRLLARFGPNLLGQEAQAIPFLHLDLWDLSVPKPIPLRQGKGKATHLVFQEPHGAVMVKMDVLPAAPPILPHIAVQLEMSFKRLSHNRLLSRLWIDGRLSCRAITEHEPRKIQSEGILLGKTRPLALKGSMWFDNICIATHPLGPVSPKPSLAFKSNRLISSGFPTMPELGEHAGSQWQVSHSNSWIIPCLNTGLDSHNLTQLAHPQVIRLSDSLNPLFVFPNPVFLPTGIKAGQTCLGRVRHCARNGNWSEWSQPCRFIVPAAGPPASHPLPRVQSIRFTRPGENRSLQEIMAATWYDIHLAYSFSGKAHENRSVFTDIILTANVENAISNHASRGAPFRAGSDYFVSFMFPRVPPYVREKEGSLEHSQLIGRKGLYCDATKEGIHHDLANRIIRLRIRLLKQAQDGIWRATAYLKEEGDLMSPMFSKAFVVSNKEKASDHGIPRYFLFISAFAIAGIALIYLGAKFWRKPTVVENGNGVPLSPTSANQRVAEAQQYMIDNFTKPISTSDVAHALNVSSNWLSKLYKQETGQNLMDCLIELRIKEAKRLLKETNLDESEIAFNSGFNSLVNFRRFFRRFEGKSPLSFRKSHK